MKITFKIKTIFASLLLLVFTYSCSDLDQEFYGQYKDENLWNTKTDFDQAINGAVAFLDSPYGFYTRQFFLMEEVPTDYFLGDAGSAGEYTSFQSWGSTFPTSFSWALWIPLYQSIYQSNLVLDRLDKFPIREDDPTTENLNEKEEDLADKNRIKGEALFFRALNYYNLQNSFGGVPVVISLDDKRVTIPKSTREEVRQLIENDLNLAATLLPDVIEAKANILPSRPSKQAAYGLLARLYINWDGLADRWKKTSDACDAIIINNPSNLGLDPDYKNIFSLSNENNKEIIFAIEHNTFSPPNGSFLLNNFNSSPTDMKFPIGAQIGFAGNWMVTKTFRNSFGSTDKRKNQLLVKYENKSGSIRDVDPWIEALVNKYPLEAINLSNPFGGNDQPIIRFADIILMKAEALNQLNDPSGAATLVGLIRSNRGATSIPLSTSSSKDGMNTLIYGERRREFFFEGLGRTDMIRFKLGTNNTHDNQFLRWVQEKKYRNVNPQFFGTYTHTNQTDEEKKYLLYPFDGLAIRNNPALIQNGGYR